MARLHVIEQSQSKAFNADLEPERRATAMGAYAFVTGALSLPASLVAFAGSKQRDGDFTTEHTVRTPMAAAYTLLKVERGVPEVFKSTCDIRMLLAASGRPHDGKELDMPGAAFGDLVAASSAA